MPELDVKQTNKLLFIVFVLFATVGLVSQSLSLKLGLLITEWGVIFLPTFLFARKKMVNLKSALRLNPISFKTALFSVLLGLIGWAVASTLEGIIISVIAHSGLHVPPQPLESPPTGIADFVELFFLVSISAGICEEFLFRGFILRGYEKWGTNRAIFFSGLLFALMHASLVKFLPILILGILFSYMAVRFNSILPTMIAHATNNAVSIILLALMPSLTKINPSAQGLLGILAMVIFLAALASIPGVIKRIREYRSPGFIPASETLTQNIIALSKMWTFVVTIVIVVLLSSLELFYMTGLWQKLMGR